MSEEIKNENNNVPEIKLPEINELIISSSPHLHGGGSIQKIMLTVVIALLPACIAGFTFLGLMLWKSCFYV